MAGTMFLLRYYLIRPVYLPEGIDLQMSLNQFVLLVLSVLLIAAGGYVINDYFDIRIDEFNNPGKPVLGRSLPLRSAIPIHAVLTALGILAGFTVSFMAGNIKLVFVHLLAGLLLWLYSARYKRKPFWGNLVIAFVTALSIAVVWLFEFFTMARKGAFVTNQAEFRWVNTAMVFFILFAFVVTLIREMIKDMEDMEGDERYGCQTLPLVMGIRYVKWLAAALTGLCMLALAFVQVQLAAMEMGLTWKYFLVVQFLFGYGIFLLLRAGKKEDFAFLSQLFRLVMVAGILSLQVYYINF
ncbi:MAG TPA: geranylgeranylglycerol-phosphate geranylgeranyltransferase [Bacteroidales bacterium]|nr:geranylgeranylglycerol-phosphate geranylgeranyltransferase [Bacteroidales bacterium]HRZ50165.1 geranylgeranylglycerol-phosphate geranylgeranyltransferase [Bacteroidales bacterium]